jgi:3D (Asp-Asp-Asp) domain-containing protein
MPLCCCHSRFLSGVCRKASFCSPANGTHRHAIPAESQKKINRWIPAAGPAHDGSLGGCLCFLAVTLLFRYRALFAGARMKGCFQPALGSLFPVLVIVLTFLSVPAARAGRTLEIANDSGLSDGEVVVIHAGNGSELASGGASDVVPIRPNSSNRQPVDDLPAFDAPIVRRVGRERRDPDQGNEPTEPPPSFLGQRRLPRDVAGGSAGTTPIEDSSKCTDFSKATELSTFCKSATAVCMLKAGTYKISKSTGTTAHPLPPIHIPSGADLCIANNPKNPQPIDIAAQSFWVQGGVFQIGSADDPITSDNKVTITMTGTNSAANAPEPLCVSDTSKCSPISNTSRKTQNARDITVTDGGQLLMYGEKGLTASAGSATRYIHDLDHRNGTADGVAIRRQRRGRAASGDINIIPYFNNLWGSNSWVYLAYPAGPAYFSADLDVQQPIILDPYTSMSRSTKPKEEDLPYLLALSSDVSASWESGDWISVSTTTFIEHETEIVRICRMYSIDNPDPRAAQTTVSVIVLAGSPSFKSQCPDIGDDTPLKHYHFGSLPPSSGFFSKDTPDYKNKYDAKKGQAYSFYDDESRNFGIDERAEVALLTRNIKLTSTAGQSSTNAIPNLSDQYFGGHIAMMNSDSGIGSSPPKQTIQLVGVELEKFGQPLVGRYPIHFHRLNASSTTQDPNLLIQDTVVHHSFNKCFVAHDTMGIKFYNNVCVRTIGQGFYLEDGHNVAANQYVRNLVAGTMAAALNYDPSAQHVKDAGGNIVGRNRYWDGDYLAQQSGYNYDPQGIPDTSDSGANTGNYIDSFEPSGFWITTYGGRFNGTNYPNLFINNSVAGCQLRGAAYWLIRQDVNDISDVPSTTKADLYPIFTGNRGHGCYDGLISGDNSMVQAASPVPIGPQPLPVPVGSNVNTSAQTPFVIFDNLTFTQIEHKAFWYRGVFIGVNNSRFSSLKQGMTLLGGGGPEGNLLGFWGSVHNSVFAGVTNNNVGRYSDCEGYYQKFGGAGASELTSDIALPLSQANEMVKCAPIDLTNISNSPNNANNDTAVFGDINANFNFQGYTFYDGPARMEDNRFINFRADVTNSTIYENSGNGGEAAGSQRYLVTTIDAHRMINYDAAGQLSPNYRPGGDHHYGAVGDAAFSWLKGNAQSVPPTQYAKGILWDNVNFKHQIFSEISSLTPTLADGDKQTVEIDKDGTLSGFMVCEAAEPATCSNGELQHYPISLNNLNIFATKQTTDEPHSQGRNNVVSSALMSPHKYATVNVEVTGLDEESPLTVARDMAAYGSESAATQYQGRGGLHDVFESTAMNNMGYTYSNPKFGKDGKIIFSFSDAPVDTTFVNRVGICIGRDAAEIEIFKVPRQWNSGVNYLSESPYWTDETEYGLQSTISTCPSLVTNPEAYEICMETGANEGISNPVWGVLGAYLSSDDLNEQFVKVMRNNYSGDPTKAGEILEGYYYDQSSGILYFNMIQYAQAEEPPDPVTPPYGTCNSAEYTDKKQAIIQYLAFSNSDSLGDILDIGCYAESGTPVTSKLLTCPAEGCAAYTIGYSRTESGDIPLCSSPAWANITDSSTGEPRLAQSGITYASPYVLYDYAGDEPLTLSQGSIKAIGLNGTVTRSYHYVGSTQDVGQAAGTEPLLPMPPAPQNENGSTFTMTAVPSGISLIDYLGPIWTLATGSTPTAGQAACISAEGNDELYSLTSKTFTKSLTIKANSSANVANFQYVGAKAELFLGDSCSTGNSCEILFSPAGQISKGSGDGCGSITISSSTITILH